MARDKYTFLKLSSLLFTSKNFMNPKILQLDDHITCVPAIHGRCFFAGEVRRLFLQDAYQCLAVELPHSLSAHVQEAVGYLPVITAVVYQEQIEDYCYVPIEPGEAIIEAIRLGLQERLPIEFIDMETDTFPAMSPALPDEYAASQVGLETYYRSVLPYLTSANPGDINDQREAFMAHQLRNLSEKFSKILFVCGMAHLEGIRKHFLNKTPPPQSVAVEYNPKIYGVHSDGIYLLTGEIPYLTFLYEKNRYQLDMKPFEKTDGIKELLLEARKEHCRDLPEEQDRLTSGAIQSLLYYLRNLCFIKGYLTPSLYDLVVAAQGVGGGGFGARVIEIAKFYPYQDPTIPLDTIRMNLGKGWVDELGEIDLKSRLPGPPFTLKHIRLERRPPPEKKYKWLRHFGRHSECSWPDEDDRIENFTRHVQVRALSLVSEDLSKVEKFSTSIKDGLDIRETLRQWHTGEIYVKELPPTRGDVGAVVFIFDTDFEKYPWRTTWHAEHQNESTLCLYATDHRQDVIGPGISRAVYGGAMFLFPPQPIQDIWSDKNFNKAQQPHTKLVMAAACYSKSKFVAYVARERPDFECRNIAKRLGRHLIYLPLSSFSSYTLRKLRKFHVLQGHHIRSYAQKYIR